MSTSGAARIMRAAVELDGATLPFLQSVPQTLVPAPGIGQYVSLVKVSQSFVPGVSAYNALMPTNTGEIFYDTMSADGPLWLPFNTSLVDLFVIGPLPAPDQVCVNGDTSQNTVTLASDNTDLAVVISAAQDAAITAPIVTVTIDNGGAGYVANDTGTVSDALGIPGTEATYRVTGTGALGVVTGVTITTAGEAIYDTFNNPLATATGGAQPGIGVGLTLNVTAIEPADGTLKTVCYYTIETTT